MYILIIVLTIYGYHAPAVIQQEFVTKEACETVLKETQRKNWKDDGITYRFIGCFSKR